MLQWYRDRKLKKQRLEIEARLTRYRRLLKQVDRSSDVAFHLRDKIQSTMAELSRLKAL
jgi:hypothetical protein